ncbi:MULTISPECIES: hypothetical protein [Escherichia]|uniref:hypothetical protein n=1 Tax=Escherichia TaxID=561 RepID=UPI0006145FA1|nr:hypothetical protein [Escherichia fergusonii]KWW08259.1 hypothetical protein VL22_0201340 [Escherichia fergusonii]
MKTLVQISASLGCATHPMFILNCEGLDEGEIDALVDRILIEYTGHDASNVFVDSNGVYRCNSDCWYREDVKNISDEDAEHLERILGIPTLK